MDNTIIVAKATLIQVADKVWVFAINIGNNWGRSNFKTNRRSNVNPFCASVKQLVAISF